MRDGLYKLVKIVQWLCMSLDRITIPVRTRDVTSSYIYYEVHVTLVMYQLFINIVGKKMKSLLTSNSFELAATSAGESVYVIRHIGSLQ